jgi:hemolysin activation/secretion protein
LNFTSWDRHRVFGQVGYAFALEDWRYQIGFETNLGGSRRYRYDLGLKLGGEYHHSTTTNDAWKVGSFSNSLAAFFAEEDYLDYYEIEGWSVYASKSITSLGEVSVTYRQDEQFSLDKNTSWSLFDGPGFRENPLIDEGKMNSVVAHLQAGYVRGFYSVPRGTALQAEVEFGEDFGGDFAFTRYEVDGRAYLPITYYGSLSLRSRVGYATGEVPFQKTFSVGGIGSVRAYPQNYFRGTQMFLGNAELAFDDVDLLFGDLQPFGFVDLGWVGTSDDDFLAFNQKELFAAAGFGVGLDQRRLRIEVAWPIDNNGFDVNGPTVWFRLNPSF